MLIFFTGNLTKQKEFRNFYDIPQAVQNHAGKWTKNRIAKAESTARTHINRIIGVFASSLFPRITNIWVLFLVCKKMREKNILHKYKLYLYWAVVYIRCKQKRFLHAMLNGEFVYFIAPILYPCSITFANRRLRRRLKDRDRKKT